MNHRYEGDGDVCTECLHEWDDCECTYLECRDDQPESAQFSGMALLIVALMGILYGLAIAELL